MSGNLKAKLFVHIGGAKCGSSSIQKFLKVNSEKLYSQGVVVPDVEMKLGGDCLGEQLQYFEICRNSMDESKRDLRERLLVLKDKYYSKSGNGAPPIIIISAENLSCWNGFAKLFEDLDEEFDAKVIIYIRRQDDYLISFWQQWYLKVNDDFWAWVLSSLKRIGDWSYTIDPWVNVFGNKNIIVRRFSRKHFKDGDLIADFSDILDINTKDMQVDFNANQSFNDAVVDLASSVRDVFDGMHDNRFYQMMGEWGGAGTYKNKPSQLMSLEQRRSLLSYYADSNESIKRKFFLSETGDLFEPVSGEAQKLDKGELVEEKMEVLARLVFGCYKEARSNWQNKLKNQLKKNINSINNIIGKR